MGRRRKNELKPGDNVTIYIPQDVEREVLHFMRTQANLSKTVFRILEGYVLRKTREYVEFDDFYSDRNDEKFNLSRKADTRNPDKNLLDNELKDFIRNAIKDEIKNTLGNKLDQPEESSKEEEESQHLESRHGDKIKKVQSIIESDEIAKQTERNTRDMDDLFSEFSKTIESESKDPQKKVEIPKSYLWEYEDD